MRRESNEQIKRQPVPAALLVLALGAAGACSSPAAPAAPPAAARSTPTQLEIAAPPTLTPDFFGARVARLEAWLVHPDRGTGARAAVRWEVADTAVAVVDSAGTLEARRVGQTLVRATLVGGGLTDSAVVSVAPPDDSGIVVIAHRAFGLVAPENTLPAIANAFDLGADAVELDVVLTRDGVPVLMHDLTVDRTTNGRGPVAALASAEVRALDACSRFGRGWGACPVPTLDEALALAARRGGRLVLDLKGPYTATELTALVAQVNGAGMRGRAMYTDFNYGRLAVIRGADATAPLGYLTEARTAPERLTTLGATAALYAQRALADASARPHVAALRAHGVPTGAWTVVTHAQAAALVGSGVRRLISDLPLDRGGLAAARAAASGRGRF